MDSQSSRWRGLAAASLLFLAATGSAFAQYLAAPRASAVTDGSYTVTYERNCAYPGIYMCLVVSLQEKVGAAGSWAEVSSGTGSMSFYNRADGVYFYRLYVVAYDYYFNLVSAYSAELEVRVGAANARPGITAQMAIPYQVRQGDLNGDGRTDLFLARTTASDALDGTVRNVVLRQASGSRTFTPVVPSAAQVSAMAYWPESAVEAVVSDINVDGFVDVTLNRVAAAVPGAADQIVIAPGQPNVAAPQRVRAFDAELGEFAGNMLDYFSDQNYFIDNAPLRYYQQVYWYAYCYPWTFAGTDLSFWDYYYAGCYVDYYVVSGTYKDFSAFSDEALLFWANDSDALNGHLDEDEALDEVAAAVEDLLDMPIGGWPMEEILGPQGEHTDPFVRRGIEIGQAVLGQARGGRNATTSDLVPPQEERVPDRIYITGHPLAFARSRGHLALEYTDSLGGGIPYTGHTLSAEPERNNVLNFGKLIARDDRPTDDPLLNFYVGKVEPLRTSNYNYWTGFLRARHENYQSLPYDQLVNYALIPSVPGGTSNSNGYIRGVTRDSATNVTVTVPFGIGFRYPGWNDPVPEEKFL